MLVDKDKSTSRLSQTTIYDEQSRLPAKLYTEGRRIVNHLRKAVSFDLVNSNIIAAIRAEATPWRVHALSSASLSRMST